MTPNLHPILVHFTVALLSTSFLLYLVYYLTKSEKDILVRIINELEVTARWCLWIVALITVLTVFAGFYAYNTVTHDEVSHLAMINHRNWAIPTASVIIVLAIWSLWNFYKNIKPSHFFIVGLIIAQGLLISTAWRGGELVYRYGLGVMSLPQSQKAMYHHNETHGPKKNIPHSHHEHNHE